MTHERVLRNAPVVGSTGGFSGGVAIDGEWIAVLGDDATLGAGQRQIA
jgi:hypothetical protein